MIIIAESGSTKTDWVVLKEGRQINALTTAGFNPNYFKPEVLEKSVGEVSENLNVTGVTQVFFYGSGCSSFRAKKIVTAEIFKKFHMPASKLIMIFLALPVHFLAMAGELPLFWAQVPAVAFLMMGKL